MTKQFSGPLDALLTMVQEKKLPITDIALAEVTEQYLAYVRTMSDDLAEEIADFLVLATRLLVMKSRLLIPQFFPDEEPDGPSLEDQLRIYKQFVEVSAHIDRRWNLQMSCAFRFHPLMIPPGFYPTAGLTAVELEQSMKRLISRLSPPKPLPKMMIDRTVSLKEKIAQMRDFIEKRSRCFFHETLSSQENTSEIVVGFLALLELVKGRQVIVRQEEEFADIMVEKVSLSA